MQKLDQKTKMNRIKIILSCIILLVVINSCEQTSPFPAALPQYDFEGNITKDRLKIDQYLANTPMDSLYRIHDPSGVIVIVQKEGEGTRPQGGSIVYTNYIGSLLETGAVFDTNIESVAIENDIFSPTAKYVTFSFVLGTGGVIRGWDIAFRRMRPGTNARILIPSPYAYQGQTNNERIPANSVLIFDVNFRGID